MNVAEVAAGYFSRRPRVARRRGWQCPVTPGRGNGGPPRQQRSQLFILENAVQVLDDFHPKLPQSARAQDVDKCQNDFLPGSNKLPLTRCATRRRGGACSLTLLSAARAADPRASRGGQHDPSENLLLHLLYLVLREDMYAVRVNTWVQLVPFQPPDRCDALPEPLCNTAPGQHGTSVAVPRQAGL
jgi:hypothetical protein